VDNLPDLYPVLQVESLHCIIDCLPFNVIGEGDSIEICLKGKVCKLVIEHILSYRQLDSVLLSGCGYGGGDMHGAR